MMDNYLKETRMLNYKAKSLEELVEDVDADGLAFVCRPCPAYGAENPSRDLVARKRHAEFRGARGEDEGEQPQRQCR